MLRSASLRSTGGLYCAKGSVPASTRGLQRAVRTFATSQPASEPASEPDVHHAKGLPLNVLALQALSPGRFAVAALAGHPFAWYKPAGFFGPESLMAADPPTVLGWLKDEWGLGSVTGWPPSLTQLLGPESMATTRSVQQHQRLRELFSPMLSDAAISRMLPEIQSSVQRYMREWSARGTVPAFTEALTLSFDVLMNQALQLGWSDADIKQYAKVAEVWNQGFTAFTIDPRFGKGMKARDELTQRFRRAVQDPNLLPGSLPATLRDEYGADSGVVTDNLIMVIFAGFETCSALAVRLLYELAQQPKLLDKLRAEHQAVAKKHGAKLSLAAWKDMPYTDAAINETLRVGQLVGTVPRIATKPINTPGAPAVPSGCPFSAAWAGMSVLDPAVKGSVETFNPDRWLNPNNKASLQLYQHPFGYGTHGCMGYRIAQAIAVAVAQELALSYDLTADTDTKFSDFPTGSRPKNELPLSLKPLAAGGAAAV